MAHCYTLKVKNVNFTFLLISNGQEWQFHIATDVQWSRNGNFHIATDVTSSGQECQSIPTLSLLTYSSQEWQFHIATDI